MPHLEEAFMDGRVVVRKGRFAHFCYDWDDALIDETDSEFESCGCAFGPLQAEVEKIQAAMWDARLREMRELIPDNDDDVETFSA